MMWWLGIFMGLNGAMMMVAGETIASGVFWVASAIYWTEHYRRSV